MEQRGREKTEIGVVVSNKMSKTVVVKVEHFAQHRAFKKMVKRWSKLKAHDEKGECKVGDKVLLASCRPLSRDKSWRVKQILATEVVG